MVRAASLHVFFGVNLDQPCENALIGQEKQQEGEDDAVESCKGQDIKINFSAQVLEQTVVQNVYQTVHSEEGTQV